MHLQVLEQAAREPDAGGFDASARAANSETDRCFGAALLAGEHHASLPLRLAFATDQRGEPEPENRKGHVQRHNENRVQLDAIPIRVRENEQADKEEDRVERCDASEDAQHYHHARETNQAGQPPCSYVLEYWNALPAPLLRSGP